jgi:hypothetical protein
MLSHTPVAEAHEQDGHLSREDHSCPKSYPDYYASFSVAPPLPPRMLSAPSATDGAITAVDLKLASLFQRYDRSANTR